MNAWTSEAETLARLRSPHLDAEQAAELADDLFRQCGEEWSPARAVGWFFAMMPPGWPAPSQDALAVHVLARAAGATSPAELR